MRLCQDEGEGGGAQRERIGAQCSNKGKRGGAQGERSGPHDHDRRPHHHGRHQKSLVREEAEEDPRQRKLSSQPQFVIYMCIQTMSKTIGSCWIFIFILNYIFLVVKWPILTI